MESEWQTHRLADKCSVKSSKRIFAREYVENGIPFFRSKDVIDKALGSFTSYNLFISEERYFEIKNRFGSPSKGDLLINSVGNRSGQPYVVQDEGDFYFKDGNILWLSEFEQIDVDYLAYWLKSDVGQWTLESVMIGSAQKALTIDAIRNLEIPLPPLPEQKAIAHILGTLDDKIELNRRMNETLEGMAQALFKSWFVDFDPVIDNALAAGNPIPDELAPRAEVRKQAIANGITQQGSVDHPTLSDPKVLFPSAFEFDDELGWIPEGWNVNTVEEIAENVAMGPFGSSIKVSTFVDAGIPVISGQHLKETTLDDNTYRFVTGEHAEKLKRSNVYRGDIIFTHAGNIGQVSLIPEDSQYERYVISQRQFYLRCDLSKASPLHLTYFFRSNEGQHVLLANASQVGVPSISRPSSYLRTIPFLNPPEAIRNSFDESANNSLRKILANKAQIKALTNLRDTLLPKLISGDLRLSDANELVEEVPE